ncbi:MAG: 4-alpha-glucanotransferase, partial [Planctomycetaceae bacterium]|nr:4-alpha-glucanotransferase [Planctomycetaceae bacterium]
MIHKRASGILLHISSLAGPFGIGDIGPSACAFADFLSAAHQSYWQILPLTPPNLSEGHSPYTSLSAFAGNPILLSPEELQKAGLLDNAHLSTLPPFADNRVEYDKVIHFKAALFDTAIERFALRGEQVAFEHFCLEQQFWLDDFALFMAFCERFQTSDWCHWP